MFAGIGTLIGLGGGVIKDIIQTFTDRANKKLEAELELKTFREKQEILLNFEKEKNSLLLEISESEQEKENLKTQGIKAEYEGLSEIEREKTEQAWIEALKETSKYIQGTGWVVNISNFILAFIRPAISIYLLWFLYSIYKNSIIENPTLLDNFITYILTFTETIISFWFYARSAEKIKKK